MALSFDLAAIPFKYVALPVVAGLAAGTGALAAYGTSPAPPAPAKEADAIVAALPAAIPAAAPTVAIEQPAPAKAKKLSCEQQTWPYIDNRCIARKGDAPVRNVRLVMAPREGADTGMASGKGPKLITSVRVVRGPDVGP